jgi:hypothetical protein
METRQQSRLCVEQVYTNEMARFFNPMMVVATVLAKVDINPYAIRRLDINFTQGEQDFYYNKVRLCIEMDYSVPDSWIEYMKQKIERLMKDAFTTSYGKKKGDDWYSMIDKDPPFFNKEF